MNEISRRPPGGIEGGELQRLWVLMTTAFVDMLGYALIFPLMPLYAKDFGANAFTIGLLLAAFALAQLLTAPLWGRLSDRVGRRPVIIGGQALSALAFLVFAFASTLTPAAGAGQWSLPVWLLLASRFAQGAGGGTISANHAYIGDAVKPEQRAKALGWVTACSSAGVMIGPAIGSLSLAWSGNDATPGIIAAGLCTASALFAWRWLPESSPSEARKEPRERPPLLGSVIAVVLRPARTVHSMILVYSSGMLAFMAGAGIVSLYLSDRFGITKTEIGYFYVVTGFVSVVMRGLLLGPLVKLLGEIRVVRLGALTIATGFTVAPLANSPGLFLVAILAMPTGTALLFPSTTSLISRYAERGETGQMHGVQQAFGGTARLLAPVGAGAAYQLCPPLDRAGLRRRSAVLDQRRDPDTDFAPGAAGAAGSSSRAGAGHGDGGGMTMSTDENQRYSRKQRVVAGVLVTFFFLVAVVTTALSLGTYCLTTDGADTRALSKTVRSLFGR